MIQKRHTVHSDKGDNRDVAKNGFYLPPVKEIFSGRKIHIYKTIPEIADQAGTDQVDQIVTILNGSRKLEARSGVDEPQALRQYLCDRKCGQTTENDNLGS